MSEKIKLTTKNAPAPTGPYSQGIIAGDCVYVAGQAGINPETGEIYRGIEIETRQTLKNIEAILAEAGCGLKDIVKITSYLADVEQFAEVNKVFEEMLPEPRPVRTTVQVHLRRGISIEIDVIAHIPR